MTLVSPGGKTEPNTIGSAVYLRLRRDILSGVIEPGTKLRLELMMNAYGVGASPLRDALNRLSSEGLVERHDQRGFYAMKVSRQELEELTRTRCWVEGLALRKAMETRTVEWEEKLVLANHRLQKTERYLDPVTAERNPEWEIVHRQFHVALISGCRSQRLISFCEQLADHAYRYRCIAHIRAGETRNDAAEHRGLAEYALANDIDVAVAALEDHYKLTMAISMDGVPDVPEAR